MATAIFNATLYESLHLTYGTGGETADAFAGTKTSDVTNASLYNKIGWIVRYNGTGSTGTSTITVEACSNAAAAAVVAIPFRYTFIPDSTNVPSAPVTVAATGFTTTPAAVGTFLVECDNSDIQAASTSEYKFVRLVATEVVNDPVAGGIQTICASPRYAEAQLAANIT